MPPAAPRDARAPVPKVPAAPPEPVQAAKFPVSAAASPARARVALKCDVKIMAQWDIAIRNGSATRRVVAPMAAKSKEWQHFQNIAHPGAPHKVMLSDVPHACVVMVRGHVHSSESGDYNM